MKLCCADVCACEVLAWHVSDPAGEQLVDSILCTDCEIVQAKAWRRFVQKWKGDSVRIKIYKLVLSK